MKPTRAMVLSAGLGIRMRPLTTHFPKPALPVMNRPLVAHVLHHLAAHGVTAAVINVHAMPDKLEEAVMRAAPSEIEVTFSRESTILGTAGGLKKAARHFGSGTFYLVNSDSLSDADLTAAAAAHAASGRAATMIVRSHDPADGYRPVHVASQDAGGGPIARLTGIGGRSWGARPGSPRTFTGVHILEPRVLDAIPAGRACDINADVYPSLLDEDEDSAGTWMHDGWWFEAGSPARYLDLNLEMIAQTGRTAVVGPGFFIDEEADVRRCAIGAGVRLERAVELNDCVVWDAVTIKEGAKLRRCIVTGGTIVEASSHWENSILMSDADGAFNAHPLKAGPETAGQP
jgi:NDP-sugar pyrophosphorylase family protein